MRRSSAFILVLLHLLYDSTKPAAHGIASLICNFQHTGMAVFHGLDPGCHISDTAYSKYFHAHIIAERIRDNMHELAKTGRSFTRFSIKSILQDPVYLIADKDAYPYFVDNEAELFAPKSGKRASPPS